jgi:hypothetical protein
VAKVPPFDEPHSPLIGVGFLFALQLAVDPPLEPAHVHDHGPDPLRPEKVPVLQKPAVGAVAKDPPFEGPHCPLTAGVYLAVQFGTQK